MKIIGDTLIETIRKDAKVSIKTIVLSESYLYVHYTLAKEKKN